MDLTDLAMGIAIAATALTVWTIRTYERRDARQTAQLREAEREVALLDAHCGSLAAHAAELEAELEAHIAALTAHAWSKHPANGKPSLSIVTGGAS